MVKNPYEPLSKEEQLKIDNEKKAIQKRIDATIKLAGECLDDPKFKKYRKEFEKLKEEVFEKLQSPMELDPIKDAYYLRSCMNTIYVLDKILNRPKQDLKRRS